MENKYPTHLQQLKNFAKTAKTISSEILSGNNVKVTDEIKKYRRDICNSCDKYDEKTCRCIECGCFIESKIKYTSSFCPLKKWLNVSG